MRYRLRRIVMTIDSNIEHHPLIIACKKQARILQKQTTQTFMQCLSLAAQAQGFKDWFSLHHHVKQLLDPPATNLYKNLFAQLLHDAIQKDATDIHVRLNGQTFDLLFRENGSLFKYDPYNYFEDKKSFIQNVSDFFNDPALLTPYQHSTQFFFFEKRQYLITSNYIPCHGGMIDLVFRLTIILPHYTLEQLGFNREEYALIRDSITQKQGFVVFSGVSGSGKTTTMNAALNLVSDKKIVHYDPFKEMNLGIRLEQENIQDALEQAYQMDFDIFTMEMNNLHNEDLRERFMQLIDKKMFLGSIHASSSVMALRRLMDFGFTLHDLAKHKNVVFISQHLIANLCPHCKIPVSQTKKNMLLAEIENGAYGHFNMEKEPQFYHASEGCEHCKKGYVSRQIVFDTLVLHYSMYDAIHEKNYDLIWELNEQHLGHRKQTQLAKLLASGQISVEHFAHFKGYP